MFLLVPAYPGCPGSKAVKRSLLLLLCEFVGAWHHVSIVRCKYRVTRAQNCKEFVSYGSCASLQVDDLKGKLAAQEEELAIKNEDANKLIAVVGAEQEKVSKEKAIANDEQKKVCL